ncbi:hypothetical protein [Gracilimonas sediminicola]
MADTRKTAKSGQNAKTAFLSVKARKSAFIFGRRAANSSTGMV